MRARVELGDCLEVLRGLPSESVDAVVTDPPYGISFMGKAWDHGVPGVEFWREILRVAKPGAHLVAFGGTRTYHRLAVAIEDAGAEIRDCFVWAYGTGFPKSLDVSKSIDKGNGENRDLQLRFTAWMRETGITAEAINRATDSRMGSHYLTDKTQPAIATADNFDKLRQLLPEIPEEIERLVCERTGLEWTSYKQRPIIGQHKGSAPGQTMRAGIGGKGSALPPAPISASATDDARRWEGWGTALKPAWEPAVMARKPLIGTVAANVLAHGTGAINVDGCRIEADRGDEPLRWAHGRGLGFHGATDRGPCEALTSSGRWPANFIHDGSPPVLDLFPREAHRFFYSAKASRADRGEGNIHPTVKPTDLMAYVCRLVTPPGGLVLDPFMGSGSTGVGAIREGFRFLGIDVTPEYVEIARRRLEVELCQSVASK